MQNQFNPQMFDMFRLFRRITQIMATSQSIDLESVGNAAYSISLHDKLTEAFTLIFGEKVQSVNFSYFYVENQSFSIDWDSLVGYDENNNPIPVTGDKDELNQLLLDVETHLLHWYEITLWDRDKVDILPF